MTKDNQTKSSSGLKCFFWYIAGIISTVLVLFLIIDRNQTGQPSGLEIFQDKGECLSGKQFKVFQVLRIDMALALELSNAEYGWYNGKVVLFMNNEGKHYYDDEIIKIQPKKCARQIGIYKYQTVNKKYDEWKTVPIVMID
ncbi:MAG: hypothetical protein LBG67_05620 [Campylobacteraceae bacterium]|nr:hypothetical protein [Campylobacteraceae bacterium]